MVALLAARFVVGSTIRVRVPPAELTVVDASAPAASGARVTSGAAACAGARVANNAAAPVVTRASAAAANRARLIDTFRKGAVDTCIDRRGWSSQDYAQGLFTTR